MRYHKLGRTDIEVSAVCMGCWAIVGDATWGAQDEAEALAAIRASLDAGVTFFDTAEVYGGGSSEELLAKGLGKRRGEAVIATKVSSRNLRPADLTRACEASLKRLKTDRIELYQVHWPSRETPIEETLRALEDLKAAGKIRALGVSNFGPLDLRGLLEHGRAESNQLPYSLLWRAIEYEIRPLCVEEDISVICYSPLCQGLLTGKFKHADEVPEGRARTRMFSKDRPLARHGEAGFEEGLFAALEKIRTVAAKLGQPMGMLSLAWLLAQPGVTSVIAGARSATQARENARAGDVQLAREALDELSAASEPLKKHFGANADMWQTESRMR